MLQVYIPDLTYLCTKSNSNLKRQTFSFPPPFFFFPSSFLTGKFSAEKQLSYICPVWPLSNESNVIRKSSWKEEHLTVDSSDTGQCKLLLRKNGKMYPGVKDDENENKAKKNGMAS